MGDGYLATPVVYDHLVCGFLLLIVCIFTAVHIYRGSKAEFAITLVAFATGFALYELIGCYVLGCITYNFYSNAVANYIYYLLYT